MSDLPRLHTEPDSELERSLLDAGRSYSASASTRAKTLAALGVVGAATSTTTAAATASKAGLAKWALGAVLVVGAAVPAARYFLKSPASAAATAALPAPSSASAVAAPLADTASVPTTPAATPSAPPNPEVAPTPAPVSAPKPSASTQGLSAELAALDSARSALSGGDASGALTSLDAYARNFPHGKLGLEAEVLRIDALAKSGQTAAAQKRAQAFIKRHPDSVLASRVRAYAGQ